MTPSHSRPILLALLLALLLSACGGGTGSGAARDDAAPPLNGGGGPTIEVEEVWRWPAPAPGSVGMPAVDAEGVAATYGHLRLVLLGLDGGPRWELERVGLRDVAPALTPELVVAATEEGVVAVERSTGRVRWDTRVDERANSPVIVDGRAVVSTWEGSLTAFDLDDGQVAWRAALPGPAIGPAATDGTTVVVTWESMSGDAAGAVAVAGGDGGQRWSVALEPGGVSGPTIVPLPGSTGAGSTGAASTVTTSTGSGSVVVLVAGDIAAHGLDLADGAERWVTPTRGRGSPEVPPLALADGEVLVAHRLAGLLLVDGADGSFRWGSSNQGVAVRGGPAGAAPDGPFAFPIDDGRLVVAGPGSEEPTTLDWPGRVSGVARAPDGLVVVATREARANHLIALRIGPGA